jgi:DNA-binding IclR family transcriptional regulator
METLEILAEGPIRTGELSERLRVDYRTARRLLHALHDQGYVQPAGRWDFEPSDKLHRLAEQLERSAPVA